MPSNFLSADVGFPQLHEGRPVEERMREIREYLYMLLENLRYTLSNLGEENFNEEALREIQENTISGLRSVVTDLEGNVSSLEQTAASITARINDVDGNQTTIEAFAGGVNTSISNIQGDMLNLNLRADGITARLNDVDGNQTTLEAFAGGVNRTFENIDGDITRISEQAGKISWIVASGTSKADMSLTPEAIDLVAQGINITGYVTFSSLETAGQSVINGDNIELKADEDGDSVSYLTYKSANGSTFGELYTRDNRTGTTSDRDRYAFVLESPARVDGDYCAMKLIAGDSMSLEAGWLLYMQAAGQVIVNNGAYATRIQASGVNYNSASPQYPTDCYIFASDGIYYNGNRIVST